MALPLALLGLSGRIIAKNKAARQALTKFARKAKPSQKSVNNAVNIGTAGVAGFGAGVATTNNYKKKSKPKMSAYEKRMRETHKKYGIKAKIGRGQK